MNINGNVTISISDFDNMRDIISKIRNTYEIHTTKTSNKYMEFDINKFLSIVEELEKDNYGYLAPKFQRQDDNIIIGEDKKSYFDAIDDEEIPF